jgi:hypothetical protein
MMELIAVIVTQIDRSTNNWGHALAKVVAERTMHI